MSVYAKTNMNSHNGINNGHFIANDLANKVANTQSNYGICKNESCSFVQKELNKKQQNSYKLSSAINSNNWDSAIAELREAIDNARILSKSKLFS